MRLGGGGLRVLDLLGPLLWVSPSERRRKMAALACTATSQTALGSRRVPPAHPTPPERLGFKGVCPGEDLGLKGRWSHCGSLWGARMPGVPGNGMCPVTLTRA